MPARNHFLRGVKKGFTEGEALRVLKINPTRFTFNKKRTELKNTTKIERKEDTFYNAILSGFTKTQEHA